MRPERRIVVPVYIDGREAGDPLRLGDLAERDRVEVVLHILVVGESFVRTQHGETFTFSLPLRTT